MIIILSLSKVLHSDQYCHFNIFLFIFAVMQDAPVLYPLILTFLENQREETLQFWKI